MIIGGALLLVVLFVLVSALLFRRTPETTERLSEFDREFRDISVRMVAEYTEPERAAMSLLDPACREMPWDSDAIGCAQFADAMRTIHPEILGATRELNLLLADPNEDASSGSIREAERVLIVSEALLEANELRLAGWDSREIDTWQRGWDLRESISNDCRFRRDSTAC